MKRLEKEIRKQTPEVMQVMSCRLPAPMIARVMDEAEQLSKKTGKRITPSAIIRTALTLTLPKDE